MIKFADTGEIITLEYGLSRKDYAQEVAKATDRVVEIVETQPASPDANTCDKSEYEWRMGL